MPAVMINLLLLFATATGSADNEASLSVLALTPSTDTAATARSPTTPSPVVISGNEAITVTFSRAVIALGSDYAPGELPSALEAFTLSPPVAGRQRWVTTSIARFDPNGEWPPELSISLVLNPELRAFDGCQLDAAALRARWSFTTPSITMYAGRVTSAMALNRTAGRWSAAAEPLADGSLEFPPDASIDVRFDVDVSVSLIEAALALRSRARHVASAPRVQVSACVADAWPVGRATEVGRCVRVSLDAPLAAGELYELVLPAGSRVHEAAGRTREEHTILLSGLIPFRFPFLRAPSAGGLFSRVSSRPEQPLTVRYRRLKLWVRHGLAPDVSTSSLTPHFTLVHHGPANARRASLLGALRGASSSSQMVTFGLRRLSPSVLQLEAAFEPSSEYTLDVAAASTVRDGFGLPMLASSITFRTAPLDKFFLSPGVSPTLAYQQPSPLRLSTHNLSAIEALEARWPSALRGDDLCVEARRTRCWAGGATPLTIAYQVLGRGMADVPRAIASLHNYETSQLGDGAAALTVDGGEYTRFTSAGGSPRSLHMLHTSLRPAWLSDASSHGLVLQTSMGTAPGGTTVDRAVRSALLSSGSLGATTAVIPSDLADAHLTGSLLVWAVNATTAQPVPAARVTLFSSQCVRRDGRTCYGRMKGADVRVIAEALADVDGIARFTAAQLQAARSSTSPSYHLLIQSPTISTSAASDGTVPGAGHVMPSAGVERLLLTDVPVAMPRYGGGPYPSTEPPTVTVLTDRRLYKPNDTVRLKCFVRVADGRGGFLVPGGDVLAARYQLQVRWRPRGGRGGVGAPPQLSRVGLMVAPQAPTVQPAGIDSVDLSVDREYGATDASVHVPVDAHYGPISINFVRVDGTRARTLASTSITVADPRPPTVELTAEIIGSRVLPPSDGTTDAGTATPLQLRLSTASLSGVPLAQQRITLRWTIAATPVRSVSRLPYDDGDGDASVGDGENDDEATGDGRAQWPTSGEQVLVTGADGSNTTAWMPTGPRGATVPLRQGDEISIELEFVGPTRERRTASLTVPVARFEHTLAISAPEVAQLPMHPFDLIIDLKAHAALGGAAVGGVPIELLVIPIPNDGDDARAESGGERAYAFARRVTHGTVTATDVPPLQLPSYVPAVSTVSAPSSCRFITSNGAVTGLTTRAAGCEPFALRSVGRHLAVACTLDASTLARTMCSTTVLGRSPAQWRARPLSSYLPLAVSPAMSESLYAQSERPSIRLRNPTTRPLCALVLWGNRLSMRTLVSSALPPGEISIQLPPLGDECLNGCDASITLLGATDLARSLLVPTSPLFDVTGPMLARFTLSINIAPPSEPVRITIATGQPVVAPGSATNFTVSLTDDQGHPTSGQVAVFAVDKSILAVKPHPVQNLSSLVRNEMRISMAGLRATDTYQHLISAHGIQCNIPTPVTYPVPPWP